MYNEGTTFRPRRGLSAESYYRIRAWCDDHGFSLSDVINAFLVPMAYYLENYTSIDAEKEIAICEFNAGEIPIPHVFGFPPKRMPLNKDKALTHVEALDRTYIDAAIEHWKKRNEKSPEEYDMVILNPEGAKKK